MTEQLSNRLSNTGVRKLFCFLRNNTIYLYIYLQNGRKSYAKSGRKCKRDQWWMGGGGGGRGHLKWMRLTSVNEFTYSDILVIDK